MSAQASGPITYREAIRESIREAILSDERVFLMGEDVGAYEGTFAVTRGLLAELGPERIRDAPLSELTCVGAGIGAAIAGMRPIVELGTINFALLALDQIVNNAATITHMSGGQLCVPLVIRTVTGAGRQVAAQHSHSLEGWLAHIPGIKLVAPATIADARFMLAAALADPNPVILVEHAGMYNTQGQLPAGLEAVDIERAAVRREGTDATIVAYGGALPTAMSAAEQLAGEGVQAEVIDLRVLRPLDSETAISSVRRTRRAVIVEEGWRSVGLGAEVAARLAEACHADLTAPIARLGGAEVPMPYPKHLEQAALPRPQDVIAAVRGMLDDG